MSKPTEIILGRFGSPASREDCAAFDEFLERERTEAAAAMAERAVEIARKQAGKDRTIGDTKAIAEKILALSPDSDYSARIRREALEEAEQTIQQHLGGDDIATTRLRTSLLARIRNLREKSNA